MFALFTNTDRGNIVRVNHLSSNSVQIETTPRLYKSSKSLYNKRNLGSELRTFLTCIVSEFMNSGLKESYFNII